MLLPLWSYRFRPRSGSVQAVTMGPIFSAAPSNSTWKSVKQRRQWKTPVHQLHPLDPLMWLIMRITDRIKVSSTPSIPRLGNKSRGYDVWYRVKLGQFEFWLASEWARCFRCFVHTNKYLGWKDANIQRVSSSWKHIKWSHELIHKIDGPSQVELLDVVCSYGSQEEVYLAGI